MASKNFWYGKDIKVSISNLAENNSGITKVNGSSSVSNGYPFSANNSTTIANGDTTSSKIVTFTAIGPSDTAAGTAGSKTFKENTVALSVTWKNGGGTSDTHTIPADIVLCREATSASVTIDNSASSLTVWSNEDMPTIAVASSATSGTAYVTAPYATWQVDSSLLTKPTDHTNSAETTINKTAVAVNGSKTVKFTATTDTASTPATCIAASTALTATNTLVIRNAAKSITLNGETISTNESSIYVRLGDTTTVSYTVNPDITVAGSALFSDAVSTVTTGDNAIDETIASANKEADNNVYDIKGLKVGNTKLQLSSSQSASTVLSSIVNIYVTIANLTKYLNMGDSITVDLGAAVSSTEVSKTGASTSYTTGTVVTLSDTTPTATNGVSVSVSGTKATFTVGTGATNGAHYFRFNGVTTVTITASHIVVGLA